MYGLSNNRPNVYLYILYPCIWENKCLNVWKMQSFYVSFKNYAIMKKIISIFT